MNNQCYHDNGYQFGIINLGTPNITLEITSMELIQ